VEIILVTAYTAFFIFLIGKLDFFKIKGISAGLIKVGYIIKVLAGISVGLVYTYYYTNRLTADTFKFFDDSVIIFNSVYSKPYDFIRMVTGINSGAAELQPYYDRMTNWYDTFSPYNDNRTMIRLNAILRIFSLGYYNVHVVIVCFLSYAGIIALVKVFKRDYPTLVKKIFFVFLLLPSVLFWCSGLLKDSLVFFSVGITLLLFDRIVYHTKSGLVISLLFFISLFLLMITKFHIFLLMIPLLCGWWLSARKQWQPAITFLAVILSFTFSVYVATLINPNINLLSLLVKKQAAFFNLVEITKAGSAISIPVLEPSLLSFLINAPIGFFTSLTRPFIIDTDSMMMIFSAIENTLILAFGIYSITKLNLKSLASKILPVFCFFYTATFFTLIGLVTPVLGAIVRYKAQALPFLVIFFILASYNPVRKEVLGTALSPQ
jgi:hypothetical protein